MYQGSFEVVAGDVGCFRWLEMLWVQFGRARGEHCKLLVDLVVLVPPQDAGWWLAGMWGVGRGCAGVVEVV